MSQQKAARGDRLVIALAGRRNAGKSALINALTGEEIAIVSEKPGTTTDPVAKAYELLPLGPVTFYDTAGLDDVGEMGEKRIRAAHRVLKRADILLLVADSTGLSKTDLDMAEAAREQGVAVLVVFSKADLPEKPDVSPCKQRDFPYIHVSAKTGENVETLKNRMMALAPAEMKEEPVLAGDLFHEGETVICVAPIDLAAPKGRLIPPQVSVIREVLDRDGVATVVKERELAGALENLRYPPALVITDSQAVLKVAADVPDDVPLTTFSILFARYKGDLALQAEGARAIDELKDGDKVLIAEACAHHVQSDDIGRVKIPRWLRQYTGRDLKIEVAAGHDFPENLESYALVVHCGGCMLNRRGMIRRLRECRRSGVAVTNYGLCICKTQGLLKRTLAPFSKSV